MIMLDKKRASVWVKIGAIVVASAFVITLIPAVSGGDLSGFFKSMFQGTSGQTVDSQTQARVDELKSMLEQDSKNTGILVELGNLYFDAGDFKSAITYYQKLLDIDKDNYDVMTDMGAAYNALNDNDKAMELFKKVVTESPDHEMAWYNLGVVYGAKNDAANKRFAWERYLALQPTGELADQIRQDLGITEQK